MNQWEVDCDFALDSGMVLAVSDSHGRNDNLEKIIKQVSPDLILHMGDSEDYSGWIREMAPCPVVMVRGNCDYGGDMPTEAIVQLGKHRVLLVHGHHHGVRFDLSHLAEAALENGCDTALFGHTHEPEVTEIDGVRIYNPGSISLPRQDGHEPSYIVFDVDARGEWHAALKYIRREREGAVPKKKWGWFW
ncbi:MAG: metallophosphoesterase [Lachnospiraceae bacterium]|nr:metallophosphoesterase [Lachnospiraceae bacterium]